MGKNEPSKGWFCHFDREKINTDSYTSGKSCLLCMSNWRKPLVQGKPRRHNSAKPQTSVKAATSHVMFLCVWVASSNGSPVHLILISSKI